MASFGMLSRWWMSSWWPVSAARSWSVSLFQAGAPPSSSFCTLEERVEITSLVVMRRGAKMEAKESSVMVFGKGRVTEMGRWSEKKAEAAISAFC
jgi:hypothetical protein